MKYEYERADLIITEFDIEDKITTSGESQGGLALSRKENVYGLYSYFDEAPNDWV